MWLFTAWRAFTRVLVSAVLITFIPLPDISAWAAPPVVDDFEQSEIDETIWWLGQIRPSRFWIDRRVTRSGRGALAIRVEEGDSGCNGRCQRNEIRIANKLRLRFGEEAWYGFSFKISGEISEHGSTRWVIGQWKQASEAHWKSHPGRPLWQVERLCAYCLDHAFEVVLSGSKAPPIPEAASIVGRKACERAGGKSDGNKTENQRTG